MIRNEMVNAEYAVAVTGDNFAEMFASMDDDYMQARSADIRDISNRLVQNLSGHAPVDMNDMEPSIIVADDLSPSETVQMDKDKILGFVTVQFSYGDPCAYDEHSGSDRRAGGTGCPAEWDAGSCRWVCRYFCRRAFQRSV